MTACSSVKAISRLLASVSLAAVLLLGLLPGIVEACYGGRCPTGEDTGETKVQVRITITVEPEGAGTVEVDGEELTEESFLITQGESVTLEADPARGYVFAGWSGSITSTENPLVTPFYNNKSITVHFAPEEDEEESTVAALSIIIPDGTEVTEPDGNEVSELTADTVRKHDTPEGMIIVSPVYDLGPDGAMFDPPLPLVLPYDRHELPDNVEAAELVIAWFDEENKEWVELDSTVNEDEEVVKALVEHFTEFCILAPLPEEAMIASSGSSPGFSFSSLDVSPVEPRVGETVTVTVVASYSGGESEAATTITFAVDGVAVESRDVIVPAGESRHVEFTYTPTSASVHSLSVNGLEGTFDVAPSAPPAALSEAVALAESDSFELPSVSLPSIPSLPALPTTKAPDFIHHWWWALAGTLTTLALVLTLPVIRRRIARYRYDI